MTSRRDIAFVYFRLGPYSASGYSQYVWEGLLNADFCEPVDTQGERIFGKMMDARNSAFRAGDAGLTGLALRRHLYAEHLDYTQFAATIVNGQVSSSIVDLSQYSAVIVAAFHGYYDYVIALRRMLPDLRILLIQDDAVSELQHGGACLKAAFVEAMARIDGFIAYQDQMATLARSLCTNVIKIHHPFVAPQVAVRAEVMYQRKNICVGIGAWNYDFMNLLTIIGIVRHLRLSGVLFDEAVFLGAHDYVRQSYEQLLGEHQVRVAPWARGDEYYHALGKFRLVLNMNGRAVAGRVSAECAWLGVPVVGNQDADMQTLCWPSLSVDPNDAVGAAERCIELESNPDFRASCVSEASRRLSALASESDSIAADVKEFIRASRRAPGH